MITDVDRLAFTTVFTTTGVCNRNMITMIIS